MYADARKLHRQHDDDAQAAAIEEYLRHRRLRIAHREAIRAHREAVVAARRERALTRLVRFYRRHRRLCNRVVALCHAWDRLIARCGKSIKALRSLPLPPLGGEQVQYDRKRIERITLRGRPHAGRWAPRRPGWRAPCWVQTTFWWLVFFAGPIALGVAIGARLR